MGIGAPGGEIGDEPTDQGAKLEPVPASACGNQQPSAVRIQIDPKVAVEAIAVEANPEARDGASVIPGKRSDRNPRNRPSSAASGSGSGSGGNGRPVP